MNKFDKIVLYQICDFFHDEYKAGLHARLVSYQTFRNLCKSLSEKLIFSLPFSKNEMVILNKVMERLSIFLG
jgi:hypothetical protein